MFLVGVVALTTAIIPEYGARDTDAKKRDQENGVEAGGGWSTDGA